MKIAMLLMLLSFATCRSLPISESATQAYSETLESQAALIRSNPSATAMDLATADELIRASNLIRISGRQSALDQNEIQDLREAKGRNDMLEWLVYIAIALVCLWLVAKVLQRRLV